MGGITDLSFHLHSFHPEKMNEENKKSPPTRMKALPLKRILGEQTASAAGGEISN